MLFIDVAESSGDQLKTALDIDVDLLDDGEKGFVDNVRTHGWFGTHIREDADGPGFSYTTGFWQRFEFPELILFSLPKEVSQDIFWSFFHDLTAQKRFPENEPISDVLNGYDVLMREVRSERFAEFFGWNRWFYGGDNFKANQVFFPDKSGRFPWSKHASPEFSRLQPNLAD